MKTSVIILFSLFAASASAGPLVGIGTLKYSGTPEYQPGACDTEAEPDDSTTCIDFSWFRRYRVSDLTQLGSSRTAQFTVVMASHSKRSGKWLLVLEKLNDEEAKKFGASFKVIDGGPVQPVVCLEHEAKEYVPQVDATPISSQDEDEHCYYVDDLDQKK